MAVGKNKRISKGKKGGKKKVVDPFAKMDWYDIKAPSMFTVRNAGKTQETKIASEGINLKVFQVCRLADRFTQRRKNQVKRNTYAQSCQIRKMVEIMVNKDSSSDFKELVAKLIPELFGKEIEKVTSGNYPLQNAFIGKANTLKAAKSDRGKLIYGGSRRLCRR